MLIAFCGLPGTGKTTLARGLAQALQATYLRINSIEEALWADEGGPLVAAGTGYRVAYAVAEDNLNLGRTVIADAVNPIRLTRQAWHQIAKRAGVKCIDVVVTCSCAAQASRGGSLACKPWRKLDRNPGSRVCRRRSRGYVIDTSKGPVQQSLAALQTALQARVR